MLGAAVGALTLGASAAWAETRPITIAPQTLASALHDFGAQTGRQIMFTPESADAKMSRGVDGVADEEIALAQLLAGTGLTFRREANVFIVMRADADPQSGSAAGDGADGTVEALIVTAQKREEDIQDVPIAISAFTQEDLTRSQVAGGPDLMTQVPNFTFTKTNFTGYSIQIRGIGTQAISATTDAAVAVAFNNTPFIRNRFFEQEFYDLERVEVLRGPQGTLYGRNATAGVVNLISAKPKFGYEAKLSADVSNYSSTRLEGMVNLPLVEDKVALRLAGAWTKREGFVTNQITGNPIDGRDLWSTRVSLRIEPTDRFGANLIWEHFEENDDRLRSAKQLCYGDNRSEIQGFHVAPIQGYSALFSQGCLAASLYSPDSYQAPNGLSLPYYLPLAGIYLPTVGGLNPYASVSQSSDLRVIESTYDPKYRAKTDLAEIQVSVDLSPDLTLASETSYLADALYSIEDYNRFNTRPGAFSQQVWDDLRSQYIFRENLLNDGVFCDPQIGCTDRLVAVDQSTARSRQFSQEFRLASNYEGNFNFSLGANYLRYDTMEKYYVFINTLTMMSAIAPYGRFSPLSPYVPNVTDNSECLPKGMIAPDLTVTQEVAFCTYIDPNPIESLNDQGHNYFLSKNPYKLISYALFGEAYYNLANNLKLTAGLRWTVDRKEAPRIPSWVITSLTAGYPVYEVVRQEWSEPTGRLTLDWKPNVAFTDETLVYASLSRGYKAGGSNPPPTGIAMYAAGANIDTGQGAIQESATHPKTFDPEYVNAFELGSKNTILDGRVTLNAAVFYYDYTGYQISQIIDRSAVNYNFDANIWGAEIEADWRLLDNLRLGFKGGYEHTDVADGMKAIDIMDRTGGRDGWIVVRPFPTLASNCIMPTASLVEGDSLSARGSFVNGNPGPCEGAYLTHTFPDFTPDPEAHNGQGFDKDLSGHELPNAPHLTATLTGDYTVPLPNEWLATLHTDIYYQSEAWARIFNTPGYDKLKAYSNINVAAIFSNEDAGWTVMAYVKNVLDRDQITGAFLNSDDTGLTTNVFLNEPRLYGLRVTKNWGDIPWLSDGAKHAAGDPYRLTVELSGQVQRQDAPYSTIRPSFAGLFDPALDPTRPQHRRLDWGDGREVRVTYRPNGAWGLSGTYRYGGTNSRSSMLHADMPAGEKRCLFPGDPTGGPCDPTSEAYNPVVFHAATNSSDSSAKTHEQHEIADFHVGRDFGLGGSAVATAALGMRFADLTSTTDTSVSGIPDRDLPDGFVVFPETHNRYWATIEAEREFKGVGPMLAVDGAIPLLGDDDTGRLNVAWSAGGGALFGKQKTVLEGEERHAYYNGKYTRFPLPPVGPVETSPVHIARDKSVTVPFVDLSLGLSYEVQRFKIGAGYRWERYFDVLDAGYAEPQEFDRTIDGPYFKLAVGFGG